MSDDVAYTAEKTDEGDIIIGGSSNSGATPKVAFAKIKSDGTIDTSFGDNGLKVWKFSPPGLIYDLDINGNDVYAAGFIDNLETLAKYITKVNDYNDIENLPHFIQNLYLIYEMIIDGFENNNPNVIKLDINDTLLFFILI